jgi:hypothetical protein
MQVMTMNLSITRQPEGELFIGIRWGDVESRRQVILKKHLQGNQAQYGGAAHVAHGC